MSTDCSTPSTPPSRTAWAWACRSAARSSILMEDVSGPPTTAAPARISNSSCRWAETASDRRLHALISAIVIDERRALRAKPYRLHRAKEHVVASDRAHFDDSAIERDHRA